MYGEIRYSDIQVSGPESIFYHCVFTIISSFYWAEEHDWWALLIWGERDVEERALGKESGEHSLSPTPAKSLMTMKEPLPSAL